MVFCAGGFWLSTVVSCNDIKIVIDFRYLNRKKPAPTILKNYSSDF